MRKIATLLLGSMMFVAHAQQLVEGSTYYLPKTVVQFHILVEKTVYKPGELAIYSGKYLKMHDVETEPSTSYRIINMQVTSVGIPDTTQRHVAVIDKKHSIISLNRDDNGVLLAVNTEGSKPQPAQPFVSAPKPAPLNAHDYMNADILAAGSKPKMAELIASEIYEIRDSRNQLTRGEADNMPKDGEKEVNRQLLFRFSKKLGLVDVDDLGGRPFYISVEDLHSLPTLSLPDEGKKSKDVSGIYVNLPGKIRLAMFDGTRLFAKNELYAAQFGHTEALSGELFGKKMTTKIVLDPVTGNARKLEVVPLQ